MKYRTKYNVEQNKAILQVYLYLMDNHQISSSEFLEITSLSRVSFYKIMNFITSMIDDLNLKATISKDNIKKYDSSLIEHEANIYYFRQAGMNYYFNLEECEDEKRILYSLVIVYLMLKNRQYVSLGTLSKILPDFDKKKMSKLIATLREVIAEDVYKNEIQSYVIEE